MLDCNSIEAKGTFYEFFAGGGMARAGLGKGWKCLFANDIDKKKVLSYMANWDSEGLAIKDINLLKTSDLPGKPDLSWASFPCQDLSLAGNGAGLNGARSGTFWPFWRLMESLSVEGRAPNIIVLENVCGALSSHNGKDFASICEALVNGGYRIGAVVIDAVYFVPQSRPRLFIVGTKREISIPDEIKADRPHHLWHSSKLLNAYQKISPEAKAEWVWWNFPFPSERRLSFADLIEERPAGVRWHTVGETARLLSMMTPTNLQKVEKAKNARRLMVGGVYKRTRIDNLGNKRQRAEVRFDDIAGCLRTPAGGSSRQIIMIVEGDNVRTRLLSPREAARLMGLPEHYELPKNYNEAYHLIGDGVVVPVVEFLEKNLLSLLMKTNADLEMEAA